MKRTLTSLSLILLGTACAAAAARPGSTQPYLYTWYMTLHANAGECLERARAAMSARKVEIRKTQESSVWGRSNKVNATIACLRQGDKTLAIVALATNDAADGQRLFNAFKQAMSDRASVKRCSISGRATGSGNLVARQYQVRLYGPGNRKKYRAATKFGFNYRYRFADLPQGRYWVVPAAKADPGPGSGPTPPQHVVVCKGSVGDVDFRF